MSRMIMAGGAMFDAALGGLSLFSSSEGSWLATAILVCVTVMSPITFFLLRVLTESLEQPDLFPAPEQR